MSRSAADGAEPVRGIENIPCKNARIDIKKLKSIVSQYKEKKT